ncbi:MlaA family lipoprotein [Actibacterium ureilyticum]|uniref:MlaA family lipoprotein n=1 Tax=Actibacterium ureilyticum TaxID=1590614 RepID=UPI001FEBB263|nr:VacJ family lipoprotein [Actibacterium ureilyticum]
MLTACGAPQGPDGVYDPIEPVNRAVHGVNKGLDTVIVNPVAQTYGTVLPQPARQGVRNFADNLGLPSAVLNNLLQFKLQDAFVNSARFLFNSTIGIGGLFDPASTIGVEERDTDFGETLHIWGVGEGAYLELPLLGPSTSRDAVGTLVDFVTDPLNAVGSHPEADAIVGGRVGARVGDRYTYSDSIDSVLYESTDSYAQSRSIYLQNRRFELGGASDDAYFDPYEDSYAE